MDYNPLEQLPEESSIYTCLHSIEAQDIEELAEPVGPSETGHDPHLDT